MSGGLERWNALPAADAERALLPCCGSTRWAREVTARRPFESVAALRAASDDVWRELPPSEWLDAFSHHPRIGERAAAASTRPLQAASWSGEEQARVTQAAGDVRDRLREANLAYERRFGHIYIVCASGKSAGELLALLEQRLTNDPDRELRVAAEEQRLITNLRLERLFAP